MRVPQKPRLNAEYLVLSYWTEQRATIDSTTSWVLDPDSALVARGQQRRQCPFHRDTAVQLPGQAVLRDFRDGLHCATRPNACARVLELLGSTKKHKTNEISLLRNFLPGPTSR